MSASPAPLAFEVLEVETGAETHGCRVRVLAPRLADGRGPKRPSLVFPHVPELRPGEPFEAGVTFHAAGTGVRASLVFPPGTSFYGTGEVPGPLERSGHTATLWNTDHFEYDATRSRLYQSHPWVLAVRADGSALGLLADTIRRGTIAIAGDGVELAFEEPFDLYLLEGPHPAAVLGALAARIGAVPLPPLWALGYHQSRWSYQSEEEVRALAAEFRRRGIPCDAIWLDIDYMDRFRVFTVDADAFPDLARLGADLRRRGFRLVTILDPGMAVDSELAREGLERGYFVRDAEGRPARGKVWPGVCHFPDFTRADVRAWWSGEVRRFVERTGVDGLWNDMNEPSVLDSPTNTLPEDCRHAGTDGSGGDHARWHNLYGQLMVAASRAGLEAARPECRPFLLTRSNHLAGARLAATWTGDNRADWDNLRWTLTMVLNLGLSGQPFAGSDTGGYARDPEPELFERWFELAAFMPFFRGHAEKSTGRKEPWAFGPEVEARVRASIERRMRLVPHLYTLFREAARSGVPPVRPVFLADPTDPELRAVEDAFLLGPDLMVAPVLRRGERQRSVLFPHRPGGWYRCDEGQESPCPIQAREVVVVAPLGCVPRFARAGAILLEGEPRPSTGVPTEALVVHVFLDPDGRAEGRLYEDEGEGHAHADGVFRETLFRARLEADAVVVEEHANGSFDPPARERLFRVRALGRTWSFARARAQRHVLRFERAGGASPGEGPAQLPRA